MKSGITLLLCLAFTLSATAQSLVTLITAGPRAERLNIVMLSEGYTSSELASNKFQTDATSIANQLLTTEPFKTYKPFFNVYGIEVASNQSGADQGSAGGTVDTYFNATFNTSGIDRLLTINSTGYSRATALLNTYVPEYDIVLVVVNDSKYGGSGGSIAVTSTNSQAPEIAIHEIGHSFGGLGDEYDYAGSTPTETPDTTQENRPNFIKWKSWIGGSTPIPTPENSGYGNGIVGLFEGAAYTATGWYRPTDTSKMKVLGEPFYAVNEEALVLSMYRRLSPITSTTPSASTVTVSQPAQAMSFTLGGPNPASPGQPTAITWTLDGIVLVGSTGRTLSISSEAIGDGTHTLTAIAHDPTPKVRTDPTNLLTATRSWTINISNQGPVAPTGLSGSAKPNGSVDLVWTDVSTDEAGYLIERQLGVGIFEEAGQVATDVVSYNDPVPTQGVSTKYRIRGINSANSNVFGPPSNVITVIPELAPYRITEPADVTVSKGKTATFSMSAGGTLLRYQWRKGGGDITGANKSFYTITAAIADNEGSYDCVVTNDVGNYISAAALLKVNSEPVINVPPATITILDGQATTLSVQAVGTATLLYQWRKNTVDIPSQTSPTLTFASPNVNDSANYDCRVTNSFGSALSKAATLTVLGIPVFTTQPAGLTLAHGQTATFTVAAKGTGTLTYQWRKAGIPISGATALKFTITGAKDSDIAAYDCVASNLYGSTASTPAMLSLGTNTTSDYRLAGSRAGTAKWQWVKHFGGTGRDTSTALQVQPGGGSVIFGGLSLTSGIKLDSLAASNLGAYVARLDSTGKSLAIRGLATPVGTTSGTVSLASPIGTSMDYLAAAITSDAIYPGLTEEGQFTAKPPAIPQQISTHYSDVIPETVVSDSNGHVFVGGYAPITHLPVIKGVAPTDWLRTITASGSQAAVLGACILSNGNLIVTGTTDFDSNGQISFQTSGSQFATVLSGTAGTTSGFIACYTNTGEIVWARSAAQAVRSAAVDAIGNLWCAGTETGPIAVALKINTTTGATEQRIPVNGAEGLAIATCTGGDVALLARLGSGSTTVQDFSISRTGFAVMKFTSAGALQWILPAFGGYEADSSLRTRLASAADGSLYAALTLQGDTNAEFSGMTPFVMKSHGADAFVARISEGPQIATPPASQIIALGQPLHLTVTAAGLAGSITYQWLKDGKAIAGAASDTFHITVSKLTDAGGYSCKITSPGGTVETPRAAVAIADTTPRTLKGPLTKQLDLSASAAGTGLTYTWWKNNVRVFNAAGFLNATTSKLRITAMAPAFADSYECRVTGPGGTISVPFTAAVLYPPVFTPQSNLTGIVSGPVSLQISATEATSYKALGLPAGLILNPTTGLITGKALSPGISSILITASNAAGTNALGISFSLAVGDINGFAKGNFQALVTRQPWNSELGGLLTLNVNTTGTVTGTLKIVGATYNMIGSVDAILATGGWTFSQRITRTGKPALLVSITSPTLADGELTGHVSTDSIVPEISNVSGRLSVWTTARTAGAYAGTFNSLLTLPSNLIGDTTIPQGNGSLTTVVSATSGIANWSGKLSDNTVFTGSCYIWPEGSVPIWYALYTNLGSVIGAPKITGNTQTGGLDWTRLPQTGKPSWSTFSLGVSGTKQ